MVAQQRAGRASGHGADPRLGFVGALTAQNGDLVAMKRALAGLLREQGVGNDARGDAAGEVETSSFIIEVERQTKLRQQRRRRRRAEMEVDMQKQKRMWKRMQQRHPTW